MDNKRKAEVLSTITKEQWEAIASLTQEQWEEILNKSEGRIFKYDEFDEDKQLYITLSNVMKEIGITANLAGYNYLIEAVIYLYKDPSYKNKIMHRLYPDVANKFGITSTKVEKNIRDAITKSVAQGNIDAISKFVSYNPKRGRPTTSELIASLSEYLKLC